MKVANASPPPQELDRSFKLPFNKDDVFDQDAYQTVAQDLLNLYTTHSFADAKVRRHAVVEVPYHFRRAYDMTSSRVAGASSAIPKS
jgi:hypothetical protein